MQELYILEVPCPAGSIACWIFLSTLEVVQTCEFKSKEALSRDSTDNRMSSTVHVQQYCLYTAELWAYCRQKLLELGNWYSLDIRSHQGGTIRYLYSTSLVLTDINQGPTKFALVTDYPFLFEILLINSVRVIYRKVMWTNA